MYRIRQIVLLIIVLLVVHSTVMAANLGDVLALPEWTVTSVSMPGTLILSDSPETVPADGITYQDTVSGHVRLFVYHVNGTNELKRFAVLLENSGSKPVKVQVNQHGFAGADANYISVGKDTLHAYLKGVTGYQVNVPAHGAAELASEMSGVIAANNELVNGIYDFEADGPVTVKVMMLPPDISVKKFAQSAKILSKDKDRLRGTFSGRDRMLVPEKIYDPQRDGSVVITLADNQIDQYLEGVDATDGSHVVNYGNYGVMYRLFMPSQGQEKSAYYMNPRGGAYAGAIGVKYQYKTGEPVLIPGDRLFLGDNSFYDFGFVGAFDAGQSLWLTFSPPGASNLPVKLIITPETIP